MTLSADTTHHAQTVVDFGAPYDLPRTLGILQRGSGDPSVQVHQTTQHVAPVSALSLARAGTQGASAWLCQRLYRCSGEEIGAATYLFRQVSPEAVRVCVAASTDEAAEDAVRRAPTLLGAADDWRSLERELAESEDPTYAALAEIRHRHPGVRLPATGALFDQLITAVLEQKVTHEQARHSWRTLLRRFGAAPPQSSQVPTPAMMRLPFTGGALRSVPSWQWHSMWVQPPLARAVRHVAHRAGAVHRLAVASSMETGSISALARQLTHLPGIGDWTAAEALQRSHGAADLPAVGDYHLAHYVGQVMTGRRTDDAGMLDLLEPFRPHRQRVVRLLKLSGIPAQRFGPRLAPEDHRSR